VTLDVYADLFEEDLDALGGSLDRVAMQSSVAGFRAGLYRPTHESMLAPASTPSTAGLGL
jgi:hypothetical protein